jgi:hypothetical protein
MWRLILIFFITRSLILYSSLKFLCLGSKNIQIIIFILNTLRGCSMRIQNTPRATQQESYWLIQGEANLIGCHPVECIFFLALAVSWRRQVLLYAHSKCLVNCSMRIQNMAGAALFYHIGAQSYTIGLRDINRAAHAIFWMRIEQIRIRFEQL